jgi:hypothetical protein
MAPLWQAHGNRAARRFDSARDEAGTDEVGIWSRASVSPQGEIIDLPFLSERTKRTILGPNAACIFNPEPKIRKTL